MFSTKSSWKCRPQWNKKCLKFICRTWKPLCSWIPQYTIFTLTALFLFEATTLKTVIMGNFRSSVCQQENNIPFLELFSGCPPFHQNYPLPWSSLKFYQKPQCSCAAWRGTWILARSMEGPDQSWGRTKRNCKSWKHDTDLLVNGHM